MACPVCGAANSQEHDMRKHDEWRDRIHDYKTQEQIEADREACGAFSIENDISVR